MVNLRHGTDFEAIVVLGILTHNLEIIILEHQENLAKCY